MSESIEDLKVQLLNVIDDILAHYNDVLEKLEIDKKNTTKVLNENIEILEKENEDLKIENEMLKKQYDDFQVLTIEKKKKKVWYTCS